MKFWCTACGIPLSIDPAKAGTSGPCPSCGTWISSPAAPQSTPITAPARRTPSHAPKRKKGRIPADSGIDHAHLENLESLKTLRILALFLLVIACCLAATWFLDAWILR